MGKDSNKKKESSKSKRRREAEKLDTSEHQQDLKRLRAYLSSSSSSSTDHNEKSNGRRRTRSMDAKEQEQQEQQKQKQQPPQTADEWRREHGITITGHHDNNDDNNNDNNDNNNNNNNNDTPSSKLDTTPYIHFTDAPFVAPLQKQLVAAGFTQPTPIQAQSWPIGLQGRDIVSIAKTGSGKTLGFLLVAFHQHQQELLQRKESTTTTTTNSAPQRSGYSNNNSHYHQHYHHNARQKQITQQQQPMLLVLAPTRELSVQIMEEATKFGRAVGLRLVCCYGGSSKYPQIAALQRGVDVIIATPGTCVSLLYVLLCVVVCRYFLLCVSLLFCCFVCWKQTNDRHRMARMLIRVDDGRVFAALVFPASSHILFFPHHLHINSYIYQLSFPQADSTT